MNDFYLKYGHLFLERSQLPQVLLHINLTQQHPKSQIQNARPKSYTQLNQQPLVQPLYQSALYSNQQPRVSLPLYNTPEPPRKLLRIDEFASYPERTDFNRSKIMSKQATKISFPPPSSDTNAVLNKLESYQNSHRRVETQPSQLRRPTPAPLQKINWDSPTQRHKTESSVTYEYSKASPIVIRKQPNYSLNHRTLRRSLINPEYQEPLTSSYQDHYRDPSPELAQMEQKKVPYAGYRKREDTSIFQTPKRKPYEASANKSLHDLTVTAATNIRMTNEFEFINQRLKDLKKIEKYRHRQDSSITDYGEALSRRAEAKAHKRQVSTTPSLIYIPSGSSSGTNNYHYVSFLRCYYQ